VLVRNSTPDSHLASVIPEDVLIQLFPPDDERFSLETCTGGKINTLKKVKKCVTLVENQLSTGCLSLGCRPGGEWDNT
jgi:hypothetical protein